MGKTKNQAELSSPSASVAGSGSLQIGRAQQSWLVSLAPRRTCAKLCHSSGGQLDQIHSYSAMHLSRHGTISWL